MPNTLAKMRGNCYYSSEALYHILGGKGSHWVPMVFRKTKDRDDTHWFLKHKLWGTILDPSRLQFMDHIRNHIDYSKAIPTGFLTRRPSKRAMKLMETLTWQ